MNNIYSTVLTGRKLFLARLAWWAIFLFFTAFTGFSSWFEQLSLQNATDVALIVRFVITFDNVIGIISLLLGITIFIKRSNDWMVILVSMMLISTSGGTEFFYWLFNQGWGNVFEDPNRYAITLAEFAARPFSIFATAITIAVFLTFPDGRWISPRAKHLLLIYILFLITINIFSIAMEPTRGLFIFADLVRSMEALLGTIGSLFRFLAGYLLLVHYRNMQNSIQRQQIKWIVVFFFGSVCVSALFALFYAFTTTMNVIDPQGPRFGINGNFGPWMALTSNMIELGLVISFGVAIFRYRLWDIDVLINKALVYSSLTALLGGLFLVSTALVSYVITKWFGKADSSAWAAAISALPVATSFNPLRERLQAFVDQYFKPEEVNFSDTFVEFQPEIQKLLTPPRIIQILSEQVKKQLNVDFARVYLLEQDNQLRYAEPTPTSEENNRLALEDKQLTQLRDGKIVVDDDGVPYSLLVPLLVPRARIPDFLGVIVLGRRMENKGYSTQILKNLETLGADAGKAIYLSQLSQQVKQQQKRSNK